MSNATSALGASLAGVYARLPAFGAWAGWMDTARMVLRHASSPRGRSDRRGFLLVAVSLVVGQLLLGMALSVAGLGQSFWLLALANLPFLWLGSCTTVKRLHDTGRSGWWGLVFVGLWIVGAFALSVIVMTVAALVKPELAQDGSWLATLMTVLVFVPAFGGLLWIHTAPGAVGENRYGPAPDASGFATTIEPDLVGAPASLPPGLAQN